MAVTQAQPETLNCHEDSAMSSLKECIEGAAVFAALSATAIYFVRLRRKKRFQEAEIDEAGRSPSILDSSSSDRKKEASEECPFEEQNNTMTSESLLSTRAMSSFLVTRKRKQPRHAVSNPLDDLELGAVMHTDSRESNVAAFYRAVSKTCFSYRWKMDLCSMPCH